MSSASTLKPRPASAPERRPTPDDEGEPVDDRFVEPTRELPLDVVFDLLSAKRRRRVLYYLLDEAEATTLGELATHLAALENEKSVEAVNATERKRVYIALYQCHLPKLDDAGVIDYESDRGDVELTPLAGELLEFLPREPEAESASPLPRFVPVVGLVGGGLLVAHYSLQMSVWLSGAVVGALLTAVTVMALRASRRD